MRMLLGIACLTSLWLFCGTSSALPKEAALPKGLKPTVKGHGLTEENAKTAAIRQAVKEVSTLMKMHNPPLQAFEVTENYVRTNLLVDAGKPGENFEDKFNGKNEVFKSWVLSFRSDTDWWNDLVRRDQEAQRKARADDRQKVGSLVIVGLALLLLVGYGYLRLDEYTHRRYTTWLRVAGVGLATSAIAGWWLVFFQSQG
jgi:hypothetical protein